MRLRCDFIENALGLPHIQQGSLLLPTCQQATLPDTGQSASSTLSGHFILAVLCERVSLK